MNELVVKGSFSGNRNTYLRESVCADSKSEYSPNRLNTLSICVYVVIIFVLRLANAEYCIEYVRQYTYK